MDLEYCDTKSPAAQVDEIVDINHAIVKYTKPAKKGVLRHNGRGHADGTIGEYPYVVGV